MKINLYLLIMSIISAVYCLSCIGPTTPLGTVASRKTDHISGNPDSSVKVSFFPSYQNFHEKFNLNIKIFDKYFKRTLLEDNLKITYNGFDVTNSMLKQNAAYQILSKKESLDSPSVAIITIKSLKLHPLKDHSILVEYVNLMGDYTKASLPLPFCEKEYGEKVISRIDPFRSRKNLLNIINNFGYRYNYNPILLASLIAQESSFNSHVVSSSKALGLTQITPIASIDIEKRKRYWSSNKMVRNLSRRKIKSLISKKELTSEHDWRLDSEKSVEGGIVYLQLLEELWTGKTYMEFFNNFEGGDLDHKETLKIILASYNSGHKRVYDAIKENGEFYMDSKNLKAAKEYVRKIFSYCNYFETIN